MRFEQIYRFEELDSTNEFARGLRPWSAVFAGRQSRGRGQRGRVWYSSVGGMWATYVLPAVSFRLPSLVFGASIVRCLRARFGLDRCRLRYPNDVMIGNGKLGGLLVEVPDRQRVLVGVGINHCNRLPELGQVRTPAVRLEDQLEASRLPEVEGLFLMVGDALLSCVDGKSPLPEVNDYWLLPRPRVRVVSHDGQIEGIFQGIDDSGEVRIVVDGGRNVGISAERILQIEELVGVDDGG